MGTVCPSCITTVGAVSDLHPLLVPLARLVGTWRGTGHGVYATITPFDYTDEWTFTDVGKPFLAFAERTWIDGQARHVETGYLRPSGPGRVELVVALPTGHAELAHGTVRPDGEAIVMELDAPVASSESAKPVDRLVRRFRVEGDSLTYELDMQAVGRELQPHLRAALTRRT